MRTSLKDILRLAWAIYRCPMRKDLRIGQLLDSAVKTEDPTVTTNFGSPPLFYIENGPLVNRVADFDRRITLHMRAGQRRLHD